jgi:plastocyanin
VDRARADLKIDLDQSKGDASPGLAMTQTIEDRRRFFLPRNCRGASYGTLLLVSVLAAPMVLAGDAVTVSQHNRRFSPDTVRIARGSMVHIVNDDKVTHHIFVNTPALKFDSGEQPIGTTVDVPFDSAGTFPVSCAIHPTMRLIVTVE